MPPLNSGLAAYTPAKRAYGPGEAQSGRQTMTTSETSPLRIGQTVPDFELKTYDPAAQDFAAFNLEAQRKDGKWTILFFYPADFTFV